MQFPVKQSVPAEASPTVKKGTPERSPASAKTSRRRASKAPQSAKGGAKRKRAGGKNTMVPVEVLAEEKCAKTDTIERGWRRNST